MSITPVSTKTASRTEEKTEEGPTPKSEFKKPTLTQMQHFMSPTDAMVSPCTKMLVTSRRHPWKPVTHKQSAPRHIPSKLADKENEIRATTVSKMPPLEEQTTEEKPEEVPPSSPAKDSSA